MSPAEVTERSRLSLVCLQTLKHIYEPRRSERLLTSIRYIIECLHRKGFVFSVPPIS
jgi:hypothetical protein